MDILNMIYEALIADTYIAEQTYDDSINDYRIKFYEYPETGDVLNPHIVIDPIDTPTPSQYADDQWTKLDFLLQIDVWSRNRELTDTLADKIRDVIWHTFGFNQRAGPKEYDQGVYRDARRYRGSLYRKDFNTI